jgi:acetolactate synthase-1/2/3 large subunit
MSSSQSVGEINDLSGGEALAQALISHGVDTVFGIPGIQLDPLYDAFYAERNRIRMVHTRHEQGAAFMAMGYAQASDRTGVFAVVPGPGLLNAMAAVSTAVAANLPVLGLTGQIPSYQIGQGLGMAHELRDQLAMSRGVVGWAERADHPAEVPAMIDDAFSFMNSGRKKPAVFEMAPDKYATRAPVGALAASAPIDGPPLDHAKVQAIAERLAGASCPAIFIGSGVFDAAPQLRAVAERLNAPVIESPSGRGAISADHPLSFNILDGQAIWEEVDVVLVVGTRFISPAMAWGRQAEVDVLRIDVDPLQISRPRAANVSLVASAASGLQAVLDALPSATPNRDEYLAHCATARQDMLKQLHALGPLPGLADAIRKAVPRDGIVVTDVTQLGYYVRFAMPAYAPRTVLAPGYQATLGYAMPAALGAKVACPDKKVVAVAGDGGFMFTVQELATAVHHKIPVVTIVVDNASYGNVKTIQAQSYGARHIGVELSNPDFVEMARSYGMPAERANTPEQLERILKSMLDADGPGLICVPMGEVPSIWDLVKRPPSQGAVS